MTTSSTSTHTQGLRTFLVLLFSQSLSGFGTNLALFAVDIWLAQVLFSTESQKVQLGVAFSIIQLATALPSVLGAPFAGSWADRHERKRTMLAADLLNGLVSGAFLLMLFVGQVNLSILAVVIGIATLIGVFHRASFDTSYAMLVPQAQLPRANSLMQTMQTVTLLFGPSAAAVLMTAPALARQQHWPGLIGRALAGLNDGFVLTIAIDLVTFWFAALVLSRLIVPSPPQTEATHNKGNFWDDIKIGFRFVATHPAHLLLLLAVAMANVIHGFMVVNIPLVVKYSLAPDWAARGWSFEAALAFTFTAFTLAGVVAGFAISAWGGLKRQRIRGVLIGLIGYGLGCAMFGFATNIFVAAAAATLAISSLLLMNIHSQTIWQITTPLDVQGRVFAARTLIGQSAWPISVAVGGLVGGRFDPGLSIGVLSSVCTVFFVLLPFNRRLRQIDSGQAR